MLSLILAIMVTDFAFDGFRFALLAERFPAIAHERAYAFAGGALAARVRRRCAPAALAGRLSCSPTGCRWSSCSRFLVILPLGEHFHIVTALPTLLLPPRPARPTACRRSTSRS